MNIKLEEFKSQIKGKNVAVIGIGVSNTPVIKMLVNYGANVTALDKNTPDKLGDVYNELVSLGVNIVCGENYLDNLSGDYIFKTPGMRYDVPELLKAKENGSVITSEMEVFCSICPAPIIAITGSDGKTTTTTLVYEMLKKAGYTCHLGGNIGKPLLPEIESIKEDDKVILELSSFQLHTMKNRINVAVVTNLSPNHLDMHKGMEEYVDAKKNIFLYQTEDDKLVLNKDNDITLSFENEAKGEVVFFSKTQKLSKGCYLDGESIYYNDTLIMPYKDILIPGMHNVENYMTAISAVWGMVSVDDIIYVAKNFGGVKHRIEFVRELNGVRYYNDSIASSPTRAIAGLYSFDKKIIIIAGGYDKKIPFDEYGEVALERVKELILCGATSDKIEKAVLDAATKKGINPIPIHRCSSYEEAVLTAQKISASGDVVMLSPACASFDLFKNFEVRGNTFKELVMALK